MKQAGWWAASNPMLSPTLCGHPKAPGHWQGHPCKTWPVPELDENPADNSNIPQSIPKVVPGVAWDRRELLLLCPEA